VKPVIKKILALVSRVQIVVVFLAFILMVSLSSWFMGNIIRKQLIFNAQVVLDALETNIKVDLLEPRTVLGNISQTIRSMILENDSASMVNQYLREITDYILLDQDRQLLGFSGIYGFFYFPEGVFIDSLDRTPPETYIPTERPWYMEAAAAGGSIVFLQPYADIATTSVVITYARGLFDDDGRLLGAVALDLRFDRISEYIIDANLGTLGYGFLLSDEMQILTHANPDFLGKKLGELNSDYATLENKLKQEHTITEYRMKNFAGGASVFFIRQLENNWYIGVVTPERVYYQELERIRFTLAILGIVLASILSAILLNVVAARNKADERTLVMLDSTPLGANYFDKTYNNIDCNLEAVKLFGLSSKQEYLENFYGFSPEYQPDGKPSREKAVEVIKKAFDEGYCRFEWMHQKLDGEQIPCQVTLVRVAYKNDFIVAGYIYDLREIKTAITLMNESEQALSILANILNGLDAMIYVTVPETGEILFINDQMKKHFNIKEDGIGQICYEIFQSGKTERCDFCPCHKLDKEPDGIVVWEEHNTLTKRIYRNTDRYIEWQDGKIAHIQHSVDITELIAAKEQAERSSRFKSQFLSRISHEIRTPMNAILGITEIQLQDETLRLGMREALDRIHNSGYLLLSIINNLLDLSKIEAGKLELTPVSYDVPSLINDTVHLNVMRYDSKPIEFSLHVDENIPSTLFGDELRIKQILNNLLSNAFKYTNEGEISMSVSAEYAHKEAAHKEATSIILVFRVADTGQGMTSEQRASLFDDYSRFNLVANRTTEGTGLGMSITRNLVQMMNGEISVDSEAGKGSVFTVRLPQGITSSVVIGREAAENLKLFHLDRSLQMKKIPQIIREYMPYGRVLIVDDVETNLYVARGLITPYGLSIETASSGFEAIEKIKGGATFDIIFMDHYMPKMDGMEATKIIRGLGYTHPIIALTANALVGQAEIFLENGFDGFISKPIDIRQLNESLNKMIRDKYPPETVEAARRQVAMINEKTAAEKAQLALDKELGIIFARDAEKALVRLNKIHTNSYRRGDDIRQYVIDVHAMKSALANIGETGLSAVAFKLEQAGRLNDIAVLMSETPAFLEALREVIEKGKPKEDDGDVLQEDLKEDRAYLNEKLLDIKRACENYDEKSANSALGELKQKKWPHSVKEMLNTISEYLLHSDFEEAAKLCELSVEKNSE
jgi:signal transduction histidine kinase/CheY-like chemotaxis protein